MFTHKPIWPVGAALTETAGRKARMGPLLACAVLACSLIHAVFAMAPHALEWTTYQDIPYLLRAADPGFNAADNYTNSVADAPRGGFAAFARLLMAMGADWQLALLILKTAMTLTRPLLVFLILVRLSETILTRAGRQDLMGYALPGAAFCAALLYETNGSYSLAGWLPLHTLHDLSPMSLAGTVYLGVLCLLTGPARPARLYLAGAGLALVTLVHPVIGLGGWAWAGLWLVGLRETWRSALIETAKLAPFTALPLLGLQLIYGDAGTLPTADYRDIYTLWRHPWHFDMTQILTFSRGLFPAAGALAGFIALAAFTRAWRLAVMLAGFAALCTLAVGVQYFGTSLMVIDAVITLGPSRFLSFLPLFLLLGGAMAVLAFLAHRMPPASNGGAMSTAPATYAGLGALALALCLSVPVATARIERGPPDPHHAAIAQWLSDNTPEDAMIADLDIAGPAPRIAFHNTELTLAVRVFAQRPVFADKAFPLRRGAAVDFRDRLETNRVLADTPFAAIACAARPYRLDYVIYRGKAGQRPEDRTPDFASGPYAIYAVELPAACSGAD